MMMFNDFVHKYKLKNETTSNKKLQQVLSSFSLNDVGIYLGNGPFSTDFGIVILQTSKGTHWVVYINENYFDSYSCAPPQNLSKFVIKQTGHCLYSEYQIQGQTNKRDSFCASYCLCILYLTKDFGIDFESTVLNLYYQRFS